FRRRQPLLPPPRQRAVPWSGIEVAACFFMAYLVWPVLVASLLSSTGYFTQLYGPDFPSPGPVKAPNALPPLTTIRWEIWISLFSFPFQVVAIPLMLYLGSGTRPYQLGLTTHRFAAVTTLACLAWLGLTPVVFSVNFLAELASHWLNAPPHEHPLANLAKSHPLPSELIAILLLAVVAAPVLEELLFRGVLLPWIATRPWGGHVVLTTAVAIAYLQGKEKAGIWPVVFVLAATASFLLVERLPWRWLPRPGAVSGIFA